MIVRFFATYTPDRCSEMCSFTGSAIVVQRFWSKLGLKGYFRILAMRPLIYFPESDELVHTIFVSACSLKEVAN